jgi:dihydroorotase
MSLDDVVARATTNAAKGIGRPDLGRLEPGSLADIAVLRVEEGDFGFVDVLGARMAGTRRLSCEMTIREGKVVFDLNGRTRADFRSLGPAYSSQADPVWDRVLAAPR